jgi:hypothetical protein
MQECSLYSYMQNIGLVDVIRKTVVSYICKRNIRVYISRKLHEEIRQILVSNTNVNVRLLLIIVISYCLR